MKRGVLLVHNFDKEAWVIVKTTGQAPPCGSLAVGVLVESSRPGGGDKIYQFGGENYKYEETNTLFSLDLTKMEWSKIEVAENQQMIPMPRYGHVGWTWENK